MRTRRALVDRFASVREATERLAAPLSPEDQQLQSMPSCSPTKWHRAHTTWFFETFVLLPRGVPPFKAGYDLLFNSYYESAGPRHERPLRGMLSRPGAGEIAQYRRAVDGRVTEVILGADDAQLEALAPVVELGIAHEEQHQELLLTDILHAFSLHPHHPAYRQSGWPAANRPASWTPITFQRFDGGLHEAGVSGDGFCFDNERPRHKIHVAPFELGSRLVTNRELKAFIGDDGYRTPSLWLSDGLDFVRKAGIQAPLHSRMEGGALVLFTLDGEREARDADPVSHVSYYEADALARYLGARLPTEFEWEVAATGRPVSGNLLETQALAPVAPDQTTGAAPAQLFGDVWEWTSSSYDPYPGFRPTEGMLGEYNGKFMVNQKVLRGGSCLTPAAHIRASYRNFWYPDTRFQMTGLRLARDGSR